MITDNAGTWLGMFSKGGSRFTINFVNCFKSPKFFRSHGLEEFIHFYMHTSLQRPALKKADPMGWSLGDSSKLSCIIILGFRWRFGGRPVVGAAQSIHSRPVLDRVEEYRHRRERHSRRGRRRRDIAAGRQFPTVRRASQQSQNDGILQFNWMCLWNIL